MIYEMNHESDDDSKDVKADREHSERKVKKRTVRKIQWKRKSWATSPLMIGMPRGEQEDIHSQFNAK